MRKGKHRSQPGTYTILIKERLMSLGGYVKATRLGYHEFTGHGCLMRIGAEHGPPWRVDLVPRGCVATDIPQNRPGRHIVWWEPPALQALNEVEPLRRLVQVKRHITFCITYDGEVVR